jgi:hypothetical protein
LRIAEHKAGQLLAAGISDEPDQPRRKGINDKHHASSLPSHRAFYYLFTGSRPSSSPQSAPTR